MKENLIIAIDGYSSTGKSSMSKIIAKNLGYTHIDSGAMYRAVTLYAFQHQYIAENKIDETSLIANLSNIKIEFIQDSLTQKNLTYLNGINVEDEIRTMQVSKMVSPISEIPAVRDYCVALQQQMGEKGGIVMDGRDIGTTVFPKADVKIFVTASPEVRAKRRFLEYQQQGKDIPLDEVLKNVNERDYIDSHRDYSPLRKADDAIEVDNSQMNLEETVDKVMQIIESKF
ncbi:(d)CMP kinase [Empedobacter falsenii]|uniref:Cytidylate kinase n=1 Tax=Empedobacter falsenii TaxID=343874 RepID=A0ABY8V5V8_9FLAO|nr:MULTISPECIES: (d)CMP kinase [Empedobacter]MCA4782618.1 (d)CMP kinase [Empedobacter stercoris]MCA4810044.1 (d)CMP kinase [Empedobacter stercoris]QNT15470.1 (d)CMP kinase [Empedobacter stercoris]WIH96120.1 (d)CMP kinase [Empedobacter falsenii]